MPRTLIPAPRILTPTTSRWHDELKAVAYYGETDFEHWIHQHAKLLFPHHYVIPFKKEVTRKNSADTRKPDLALIRKDLSEWSVVEVELKGHGLDHILEQVRVFRDGDYNLPELMQYAKKQIKIFHGRDLTLKQLERLFGSHQPAVLVIADKHEEKWVKDLRKLDVQFCILEIYKSTSGDHVYRALGQYPVVSEQEAHCRPHPWLPNTLEVVGPFTFTGVKPKGTVNVTCDEHLTQWCLLTDKGKQYLQFMGTANPLPGGNTYGLFRDKSDNYYFRRN